MEYTYTLTISKLGGIKIFDKNNEEITKVNDGEIYVPSIFFQSTENDYHEGGKIHIDQGGTWKEFTIKGYTKDALFGTAMTQMTRFLVSENDLKLFESGTLHKPQPHAENERGNFFLMRQPHKEDTE